MDISGDPYGKELTAFNIAELAEESGAIGAKVETKLLLNLRSKRDIFT